jgi:hypothetical protein
VDVLAGKKTSLEPVFFMQIVDLPIDDGGLTVKGPVPGCILNPLPFIPVRRGYSERAYAIPATRMSATIRTRAFLVFIYWLLMLIDILPIATSPL